MSFAFTQPEFRDSLPVAWQRQYITMKTINRRTFLGAAAVSSAALGNLVTRAANPVTDASKLKLGLIGCGWYGMVDVKAAFKAGGVEVVALCDVDSEHLTQSADEVAKLQGQRPQTFKLYADLLQTLGRQAVIIATPPHWHALQFIAAVERGLDVYCEKPLAYEVREGRTMIAAAQKSGRIVQLGFQRHLLLRRKGDRICHRQQVDRHPARQG